MILIQRDPSWPDAMVQYYVMVALQEARANPSETYQVSLTGWGINARDMVPWFKDAPRNVRVPVAFMPL